MTHTDTSHDAVATTIDPDEIARFSALAAEWWDPEGKFAPLHRLNPVRLGYIRDRLCAHFGRDARAFNPFEGLSVLDIGCGGGLVTEPMARLGASVTGIDAAARNIGIARTHAEEGGLAIDYLTASAESLAAADAQFDAVLALEVVEHVADVGLFLACCTTLVRPGGALILSTLNRTPKSFLLAIVGAEYVLRWLPRGTHSWEKFVKPSELADGLARAGGAIADISGMVYSPFTDDWRLASDVSVNYLVFATKDGPAG